MKLNRPDYQHIRGFNYIPSYAMVLNDVMDNFDENVWDREFAYAEKLCANSLRVWVSMFSFMREPILFLRRFETILSLAEKHSVSIMPVLFNRWVDRNYPFGSTNLVEMLNPLNESHKKYIFDFLSAFHDDKRILMWDLCNEPYCYYNAPSNHVPELPEIINAIETRFWTDALALAREAGPSQPLTIGFSGPVGNTPECMHRAVDVMSFHPYEGWDGAGYAQFTDEFIAAANRFDKPLICTETCQGSLDDRVRAKCIESCVSVLSDRQTGWYVFQLMGGEMVSARPDRTDENCLPGDRGYFPFVNRDGTVRIGHEIVRNFNKQHIIRLF